VTVREEVVVEHLWTDQLKRVLELAREESARLGHPRIDTEHLLLGIIEDGSGPAVTLLMSLGLNLRMVRQSLEDYVADSADATTAEERQLTPRARRALEEAGAVARRMRRDHVGTEHLLVAMQEDRSSAAAQILAAFGLHFRSNPVRRWRDGLSGLSDDELSRFEAAAQGFLEVADGFDFCADGFADNRILLHLVEADRRRRGAAGRGSPQ
jgi:ATP-dependent Clp protease ATP-binding subunit ClpC